MYPYMEAKKPMAEDTLIRPIWSGGADWNLIRVPKSGPFKVGDYVKMTKTAKPATPAKPVKPTKAVKAKKAKN